MKTNSLKIGNLQVDNNVFLAPIAGYTDYPFRQVALKTGYGLCFTELVSAKGLIYGGRANAELCYCGDDIDKTSVQIFGSDLFAMRTACESEYLRPFKIIDINMGCPVPKVYKNGDGVALLNDLHKAGQIISECVKSGKIITVKTRTGLKQGDDFATEFAKMAEDSGASLITIHGRVREMYYSGEVDYDAIYKAKKSVKIPVIANGGIFTIEDANEMVENTGCDGIMLARGGLANPFLASQILGIDRKITLQEFILSHLENLKNYYSPRRSVLEFRKFVSYYFKGIENIKEVKMQLYSCEDIDKMREIIIEIFNKI